MVSRNRYKFCSLLLSFFVLLIWNVGCTQSDTHTIDENTFARTLGELMVINRLSLPDSTKTTLVRQLFEREQISEKDFLQMKAKFRQDEVFWRRIYHKAQEHIKEMEKNLQSKRMKH